MQSKSNFNYNGGRKAFNEEGSCSFGNEFGENVVFFVIDNTSSSHTDNQKNNFYYVKD